jgi:hypothetical protein
MEQMRQCLYAVARRHPAVNHNSVVMMVTVYQVIKNKQCGKSYLREQEHKFAMVTWRVHMAKMRRDVTNTNVHSGNDAVMIIYALQVNCSATGPATAKMPAMSEIALGFVVFSRNIIHSMVMLQLWKRTCSSLEHACASGVCISRRWMCDGMLFALICIDANTHSFVVKRISHFCRHSKRMVVLICRHIIENHVCSINLNTKVLGILNNKI